MTVPTAQELMMLADGELTPQRRAEVEAWLSKSDGAAAAQSVEAIRQVGDFVRVYAESTTRGFDVADDVIARISAPELVKVDPGGSNLRHLARARSRVGPFLGALSFAVAAAAVAVVWLGSRPSVHDVEKPRGALSVPIPLSTDLHSPELAVDDPGGASILAVDFGTQNGSIFMVNAGRDVTPVVWLLDDSGESGDRMEPL
jgi:hypothetical protein